jgi:hypothetical protein
MAANDKPNILVLWGDKALILLFLIVGVLVCLPYQVWFKRHRLAVP